MSKVGLLIGLGATVLTFIFLAASCGGNNWVNGGTVTQGLWKKCVEIYGSTVCGDLTATGMLF